MTDIDIIRAVLKGDTEAYAELVRTYHARIRGLCLSFLFNTSEADDAAQEVFLKAFASLRRYTPTASFLTWTSRIASNHCLDILRKRKRQKTDSLDGILDRKNEEGGAFREMAEPEDRSLEQRQDHRWALQVLSNLTQEERHILVLREVEQLSYEDISKVLRCTVEAVRARLRRARLELQARARHLSPDKAFTQ